MSIWAFCGFHKANLAILTAETAMSLHCPCLLCTKSEKRTQLNNSSKSRCSPAMIVNYLITWLCASQTTVQVSHSQEATGQKTRWSSTNSNTTTTAPAVLAVVTRGLESHRPLDWATQLAAGCPGWQRSRELAAEPTQALQPRERQQQELEMPICHQDPRPVLTQSQNHFPLIENRDW